MSKGKLAAIIITSVVFIVVFEVLCMPDPVQTPRSTDTPPSAEFTITKMEQSLRLGEWSEYVYIHYDVRNTGRTHIRYYQVDFTITYDDGTHYEEWTNGSHLLPGERRSDWTIYRHEAKEAVSVEVSDYELTGSRIPEVIYDITGTAEQVFVTLSNAEGGTEQYSSVRVPQRYVFTTFPADMVYISAQNEGASGTVRVSIRLDGKLFRTSESSGAYVIATASGPK